MPATTTPTLADMHSEPTTEPPRLGQLILILVLDPVMLDLPATLTPRRERRVELLIDLPRRLAMTMLPCSSPDRRPSRRGRCFGSPRENGAAWRFPARRASSS
jgi:hypothetical protein